MANPRKVVIDLCSDSDSDPEEILPPPPPPPPPRPRQPQNQQTPRSSELQSQQPPRPSQLQSQQPSWPSQLQNQQPSRPSQPRSQQSVPESRFITPSDDESEEEPQVVWATREKKEDVQTKSLRATGHTRKSPSKATNPAEAKRKSPPQVKGGLPVSEEVKEKPPPPKVSPSTNVASKTHSRDLHVGHTALPSPLPSQPAEPVAPAEIQAPKPPTSLHPVRPDTPSETHAKKFPMPSQPARPVALGDMHAPKTPTPVQPVRPDAPSRVYAKNHPTSSQLARHVAPGDMQAPRLPVHSQPARPVTLIDIHAPKPSMPLQPARSDAPSEFPANNSPSPSKQVMPIARNEQRHTPSTLAMPDSKPVSILSPATQQWLAASQAHKSLPHQSSVTPDPAGSNVPKPSPAPPIVSRPRGRLAAKRPTRTPISPPPVIPNSRVQPPIVLPKKASLSLAEVARAPNPVPLALPVQMAAVAAAPVSTPTPPKVRQAASSQVREAASPNFREVGPPKVNGSPPPRVRVSPRSSVSTASPKLRAPPPKFGAGTVQTLPDNQSHTPSADTFVTAASQSSKDSLGIPTHNESVSKRKADVTSTPQGHSAKRLRLRNLQEHNQGQSNPSSPDPLSLEPFENPLISIEDDAVMEVIDVDDEPDNVRPRFSFPDNVSQIQPFPYAFGKPFGDEEDALIVYLKEQKKLVWKDLEAYFPGRKWTSLQSRYSNNLSPRALQLRNAKVPIITSRSDIQPPVARQPRQHRPTSYANVVDVVMGEGPLEDPFASSRASTSLASVSPSHSSKRSAPALACLVRHREFGSTRGRDWPRKFHSEIKDHAYSTFGFEAFMNNASGDVSAVAWSPNGAMFAAGAVAVTDEQSIQYNKPRNMVVGKFATSEIKELDQHRISRPPANDLFSTVQMVGFSPDSHHLYSVSIDRHLNVYKLDNSVTNTELVARFEHPASVDFLSINSDGVVATGCAHSGPRAIRVFSSPSDQSSSSLDFSATNATREAKKTPSALRWGTASQHKEYLLAAFSCATEAFYAEDDDREKEGEICLWDVRKEQHLETRAPNRNVFDVSWNPNPSPASSVFAVASGVVGKVNSGIRSVVRLYSPDQHRVKHLIELECPAWDINDVLYSPYDENIIAVGSTDGKVFIWDIRFAKNDQLPARTLKHGLSLSVLPHEKKRWETDTGIRFLSWGEQRDRVYTGSSDGVVKTWNPYRSDQEKHVRDVARFGSAIMSGAFSPDHCSLLIGEDQAKLNLLSVGNEDKTRQDMKRFIVHEATALEEPKSIQHPLHKYLVDTGRIEFRPMGTLPIRQAVQGPNYDGPYLKLKGPDEKHEKRLRETAQKSQEKALRMLRRQNKRLRKTGETMEQCGLDCAYKPIQTHEKDEPMEESGRSQDRIPDSLRQKILPGRKAQFQGLNAKCKKCGAAARIPEDRDTSAEVLCERCNFSCFRCGEAVEVSPRTKVLECLHCGVAWSIGALGYEVLRENPGRKVAKVVEVDRDIDDTEEEFGEEERDFFLRDLSDDGSAEAVIAGRVRMSV